MSDPRRQPLSVPNRQIPRAYPPRSPTGLASMAYPPVRGLSFRRLLVSQVLRLGPTLRRATPLLRRSVRDSNTFGSAIPRSCILHCRSFTRLDAGSGGAGEDSGSFRLLLLLARPHKVWLESFSSGQVEVQRGGRAGYCRVCECSSPTRICTFGVFASVSLST